MYKVALINKYLPYYRLAVFRRLSLLEEPIYEIVGGTTGREGIKTIPLEYSKKNILEGGIRWKTSKSFFYRKSLQLWQTNVISKIFSKDYKVFILDGAISHISTWIFSLLAKIAGKKVLFWTHGLKGTDRGLKRMVRIFFFKRMPHGLLLYGNFSKEHMVQQGFDALKLFVIGNSLDYDQQRRLRDEPTTIRRKEVKARFFTEDLKTLIFVGRLVQNKNVNLILKALFELNQEGTKFNCLIVGDGPEKKKILQLVSQYKIENYVCIHKAIYDERQLAKVFFISDLMVSPGNVGLNCIHSLSYGVPVLTHNNFQFQNPEVEAIREYENGLLYQYEDFQDMKNQIKHWFQHEPIDVKEKCIAIIEEKFNPVSHAANIDRAVKAILNSQ